MSMKAWTRWQDWVNVVAGLWLIASPWVLGVAQIQSAAWTAWVLGVLIAIAALWALAQPVAQVPEWCNVVLGILAIISPWVLGFSNLANPTWSIVIAGIVVLVLSGWVVWELGRRPEARRA